MPSNSTGTIAIYEDIVGQSTFTFSPQLTGVRASKIPANAGLGLPGLTVFLPADPSDGDSYEFQDVDGSCGVNNIVFIKADPGGTATVGRLPFFGFIFPSQGVRATFDAEANDWALDLNANGLLMLPSTVDGTGGAGGNAHPGDLTSGTTSPAILFAFQLSPKAGGLFFLSFSLEFTLSAPDTVTIAIESAGNVTSVSGGTTLGTKLQVEGPGPVTVASDAPVQRSEWAAEIPAGATAKQTATWAGVVALQSNGNNPAAIIATIATAGGASLTGMSLAADTREIA
jgi:hypothetical protein